MTIPAFIRTHGLAADGIPGAECLALLLREMELGLQGTGRLPMIPSYLSLDIRPAAAVPCCVIDAGGTNLRLARAEFTADGRCHLERIQKTAMPGTRSALSSEEFYSTLAGLAVATGAAERIGLCFSYTVALERDLDGILHAWCKEVQVPDALGKPVGASLLHATGGVCRHICVLNDSVAALLGAHSRDPEVTLGLILGTGINVCYSEQTGQISKLPVDMASESMIISTEVGEFDGFPKNAFEEAVIRSSDDPDIAPGEKQCAGAYLGDVISLAWQAAARAGLIDGTFLRSFTLPEISDYLGNTNPELPEDSGAVEIATAMIHRAAKIAAVLTAGPVLKSCPSGNTCTLVIEGSQYWKLTGFRECFDRELAALLAPQGIRISVVKSENSCLLGAALAAFAEPM